MQDKNNKMSGADFITSLLLIALGAAVIRGASQMRVFRTLVVSPGLFPMILGGIFVVCGLVMLAISIKNGGIARARRILSLGYLRETARSPRFHRGCTVFLLILAYVALFGNSRLSALNFSFMVGDTIIPVNTSFIAITFGYLFATFSYLKAMPRPTSALVSIVASLAIFYAFNLGFGIPVP